MMNINLPNGVCDTINIFQGDDAGVLASNFAALHHLGAKKQGKLRELIVKICARTTFSLDNWSQGCVCYIGT